MDTSDTQSTGRNSYQQVFTCLVTRILAQWLLCLIVSGTTDKIAKNYAYTLRAAFKPKTTIILLIGNPKENIPLEDQGVYEQRQNSQNTMDTHHQGSLQAKNAWNYVH